MDSVGHQNFQTIHKTRVSEGIIEQIRDLITSGRIRPGDRLPAERELAKILGVGRSTVREAIRALESLGIVHARAGEGTFLATAAGTGGASLSAHLFEAWQNQQKLFEVRQVIEPDLAALAARRATDDQIARMRAAIEEQEQHLRRGEPGIKPDNTFHFLLAQAAGNDVLLKIMESLMDLLRETREAAYQRGERPAESLRQHRTILKAIEARDAAKAHRRMVEHIRGMEQHVFDLRTVQASAPTGAPS